jgi:hypothetical protein
METTMMRRLAFGTVLFLLSLLSISCKDDKPTAPPLQAFAVSLQYQNYFDGVYCFLLKVGNNSIDQCGLGIHSESIWAGDYDCELYSITNSGGREVRTLIATSPLHLDRNFTCVIDGYDIYWMYWG